MDVKKLLTGTIAGAVTTYLLGWLIFGMFIMDFIDDHSGVAGKLSRAEPDQLFLILGNLVMGLMFTYIFIKSNISSMAGGLMYGGIIGLLMSAGRNCITYSTTIAVSKTGMAADVIGATILFAVSGAVIGMVLGMGKKADA